MPPPVDEKGHRRQQARSTGQDVQIQPEQEADIGEVGFAALRPLEDAGGELLRPQAVVQHLVEGGLDLIFRQPGALHQL